MKYRRSPSVVVSQSGSETAMVFADPRMLRIEGTAFLIWSLLDVPLTAEEIVARCLDRYDGSTDEVSADVAKTLRDWLAWGLIESF
jgi:hypothetical protein